MFKKIFNSLFLLIFIFSFAINFCDYQVRAVEAQVKNKAVMLIGGAFSNGLFERDESGIKYNKNESIWMPLDNNNKYRMVKGVIKFKLFHKDLSTDENGKLINKNIGLPLKDEKFPHEVDANVAKYGVGNCYKKLIDNLNEKFPDYNTFLYNYDWRLDINKTSKKLTKEIQKYDEVILIGYSLGGLIACKSAVELKKLGKLNKIKKYISIAVPYNGTVEPFYVLSKGMTTENDFMAKIIRFLGIPNIVKNLAVNAASTYQMLPSKTYFDRAKTGYITNTKTGGTLNYKQTLEFLKNCSFAKKSDGSLKRFLNQPPIYDRFFVNTRKYKTHILNFLDYHIIAGYGLDTMSELTPDIKNKNQLDIKINKYLDGDGTIAFHESAIPFDGIAETRIFKIKARHQFLIENDKVIENIINKIEDTNISPELAA
ncbi:MAG: hypothetical protein NkDv07_0125 [Candidatus Improbicoccus devescovinae]|nr:MAG: hypothetical protein NkDv07_0125 [Candidatus Improbicoccus devescovinae]